MKLNYVLIPLLLIIIVIETTWLIKLKLELATHDLQTNLTNKTILGIPNVSSFQKRIMIDRIEKLDSGRIVSFGSYGACKPFSTTLAANYVKVEVHVKGTKISIDDFFFDNLDYASEPGCFNTHGGDISMVNYVQIDTAVKKIPFSFSVRTDGVEDNTFEMTLTVSTKDGKKVLSKFPAVAESLKGPIHFLQYPVVIKDTLKFK